jgi:hypothetical protein
MRAAARALSRVALAIRGRDPKEQTSSLDVRSDAQRQSAGAPVVRAGAPVVRSVQLLQK